MNKNEIGKMISLADDSYIEEMFTTKLYERKHHGAAWIAAAAAIVIAVGAAGFALNSADSDKIITDLQEILTETETDTSALESAVTTTVTAQEWSYRTNNRDYFKSKPDDEVEYYYKLLERNMDFTSDGPVYRFTPEYLDGILRFERKDFLFIEGGLQCDENGVPLYAGIRLFNDGTENLPMVHMAFYSDNSHFVGFDKSLYTPEIYGDTELYGFDLSEEKDGSKLMACWRYGDTNYMFTSRGLSYDEFIKIISPYIEFYSKGDLNLMYRDYFTLDSFDLNSKGVVKAASYDKGTSEMNNSSVFAGYVPDYTPFVGLHYAESSDNYDEVSLNGEVVYRRYDVFYLEYGAYDGKEKSSISLTYEWGENPDSDTVNHAPIISFEEITPEKLDEILFDEDNWKLYQFIIPVNDFTITVLATCEREQLLEAIDAIRSGGKNVTVIDCTAIDFTDPETIQELMNISFGAPFAGYVPRTSSIGELNLERIIKEEETPSRLQLQYRGKENESDKAYTEYVHLYYYNEREIGDRAVRPVVSLEDITAEKLEEIKYFGDSHVTKHSFYVTVSDFFIRVEALCSSEQLMKFFENMPNFKAAQNSDEINSQAVTVSTKTTDSDDDMVIYDGRVYYRSMLSEETLEWLDWYNSASKEEQDKVSYVPSELLTFLEYWF